MSGIEVAILTAFKGVAGAGLAAGAAGTAGGIFAGGGLMGLAGSVIGGVGSAMSARSERKAEERSRRDEDERREQSRIDEEKRREGRYSGAGEAVRFWERDQDQNGLDQTPPETATLGQSEMVGDQYSGMGQATEPPMTATPQRPPTYSYDRNTGRLVTS